MRNLLLRFIVICINLLLREISFFLLLQIASSHDIALKKILHQSHVKIKSTRLRLFRRQMIKLKVNRWQIDILQRNVV